MIYRFRIVLDTLEDVFRDLEIEAEDTLEDLSNAIIQAFGFDGNEMASFYLSDEAWEQGEEIAQFDLSEGAEPTRLMNETAIDSVADKAHRNLIYVYDFLAMWTFYVELAEITDREPGKSYPNLMFSHGILPEEAPDKQFKAEEDAFDFDDFNEEGMDFESLDDWDFDDQWN